ncbi:MAG: nickel pincer cofactor biosynthesis protein LarB [Christensenellaceae bacterium]
MKRVAEMNDTIDEVLKSVANHEVSIEDAKKQLAALCTSDIGHTVVDHMRECTQGYPEVVFGMNKSAQQLLQIAEKMIQNGSSNVLFTRIDTEKIKILKTVDNQLLYDADAQIAVLNQKKSEKAGGTIAVVCAGTSDIGVAQEAAITAEAMGNKVLRIYDVGIAGLHRLLARIDEIRTASVVVAVAGMEGALPSVIKGLIKAPVIAVPTSIGYGAAFGGIAALLAMLNSCSSGIGVVNIDNGFGAGYLSALINQVNV